MSRRFTTGVRQPEALLPLHDQFLKAGQFLRNWTPATLRTYRQGLIRLGIEKPTKADLIRSSPTCRSQRSTGSWTAGAITCARAKLRSFTKHHNITGTAGTPVMLFERHSAVTLLGVRGYDVSENGQRFLTVRDDALHLAHANSIRRCCNVTHATV